MSVIKPFSNVRYNPEKIEKLDDVICPPYDVISEEQQQALYAQSPYNFIRLSLTKGGVQDDAKYQEAKDLFDKWQDEGILTQDDKPGIYFYRQEYTVMGQKYTRLGFISLLKMEDESKVFAHEKTHKAAKEDRFKLWDLLDTKLSSIFVCFSDKQKKVESIFLKHVSKQEPYMDVMGQDNVRHIMWQLTDEDLIKEIQDVLSADQQLFIADGHHRHEVSRQLRERRIEQTGNNNGDEPYQYVMSYFTNMDSKDLQIFPMHRIVKEINTDDSVLEEFFRIDAIKDVNDLTIKLAQAGKNEHAFGLYTKDGIRLLRLKSKLLIDEHIKEGSKPYRHLDATILKHFVFDKQDIISDDIVYTKDIEDITTYVDEGKAQAGFIMNPVKMQELRDIALNGERMPPKTTYFFPKVLSGMTVFKH